MNCQKQVTCVLGERATCLGCCLLEVLIRNRGGQWRGREEAGYELTASAIAPSRKVITDA
jgi:hypothetical protein